MRFACGACVGLTSAHPPYLALSFGFQRRLKRMKRALDANLVGLRNMALQKAARRANDRKSRGPCQTEPLQHNAAKNCLFSMNYVQSLTYICTSGMQYGQYIVFIVFMQLICIQSQNITADKLYHYALTLNYTLTNQER